MVKTAFGIDLGGPIPSSFGRRGKGQFWKGA